MIVCFEFYWSILSFSDVNLSSFWLNFVYVDWSALMDSILLWLQIWQCGGKILWVPCSRVGHIYRAFMPYTFGKLAENKKGSLITIVTLIINSILFHIDSRSLSLFSRTTNESSRFGLMTNIRNSSTRGNRLPAILTWVTLPNNWKWKNDWSAKALIGSWKR